MFHPFKTVDCNSNAYIVELYFTFGSEEPERREWRESESESERRARGESERGE